MSDFTIGVVGNPNCGKTTLFNALTGAKQRVGNWPGVTVDRKTGRYKHAGKDIEVVDLPGIYSLAASSLDEEIARDYILSRGADLIVNIIDASNIERNLYLTVQLLEMKAPVVIALNMMDIARAENIEIKVAELAEQLGCPVVPMTIVKGAGVEKLKSTINTAAEKKAVSQAEISYPGEIEAAIKELFPVIRKTAEDNNMDSRWAAVKLLEGDQLVADVMGSSANKIVERHNREIEAKLNDEADIMVADGRYGFITDVTGAAVKKRRRAGKTLSDRIDAVILNRALGIPIFLAAMYLMFMITINLGGAFIDFFDVFAGTIFVDGFAGLLSSLGIPDWVNVILSGGLGGSIQTIATFIPPIGFMFLCLSFLEDSGYMARAAFVMDRFMRIIGLPGKSFVPMLVGFGCNVPAIMATRTLENQRDRTLTIMMNPFMSCGARLPVYALFAAAFFPVGGQNMVFGLYLIGIMFAVITGLLLKNTLLKGEITPFVMELPPYHMPTITGVFMRAWDRLQAFILRASKVLIPVIVILSFLNSLGTDGTFGHNDSEKSVLSTIGKAITPIFSPMGISNDNWPATVGIFTGIFAKEAVVGTLDAMYTELSLQGTGSEAEEEKAFDFWGGIKESFVTIPVNLAGVAGTLLDPLGISVGDVSNVETAAEGLEVSRGTFGSMVSLFAGKVGAFAYLLFILLYFPCGAAVAAIYRETNLKWTLFAGIWTTFVAYMAATVFFQAATMGAHPGTSITWIAIMACLLVGVFIVLRLSGHKEGDVAVSSAYAAL